MNEEYHMSEEQYDNFWKRATELDIDLWIEKFGIQYKEHSNENQPGYWGTLVGPQSKINWLLLQL